MAFTAIEQLCVQVKNLTSPKKSSGVCPWLLGSNTCLPEVLGLMESNTVI